MLRSLWFDHLVLTVKNIEQTTDFYRRVFGMEVRTSENGRVSLYFGSQKINLHLQGHEIKPHAQAPVPGSADFCLLTDTPLADMMTHLHRQNVPIVEGPVRRLGAAGPMDSVYFRDPDGNLVEIGHLLPHSTGNNNQDKE